VRGESVERRGDLHHDHDVIPPYRPFRPRPTRTLDEARAVGRAWADHEASDPGSLKGTPSERETFFYFFEEVVGWVDAPDLRTRRDLVYALGDAACERWAELANDAVLAWSTPAEGR